MKNKVEFQPPAGAVPEGLSVGDEFDLVCSFRVKPSGQICLIQLGEIKMPGYSEDAKTHDNYASEAKAMRGGMTANGGNYS